jgi:hypothetical protein
MLRPSFNAHETDAQSVFFLDSGRPKGYVELLLSLGRYFEGRGVQKAGSPADFSSHQELDF